MNNCETCADCCEEFSYYRCSACTARMTSLKTSCQTQKIIQNTVRVPSSLYTMNVASVASYKVPQNIFRVNWNQMSDKSVPSVQTTYVPGRGGSSTRSTLTGTRPGSQSPGGTGCDIKHNSYDRYLNNLKAKGPLRPETSTSTTPIYGNKNIKTTILYPNCNYLCLDCV